MSEQRGPGRKPDVKIAIKAKEPKGAQRFYIAAGWREDGKLRLKFDRDIVSITMKDGAVLDCANLYIDLYENDGNGPQQSSGPRAGNGTQRQAPPADSGGAGGDFDDSDIPFAIPFSLPI